MNEPWSSSEQHRAWLTAQAGDLLRFFRASLDRDGRFVELDDDGRALPYGIPPALRPQQRLLTVTRTVHCYATAGLLGIPGGRHIVERGLDTLWTLHRDRVDGGYFATVDGAGPVDATKAAYGHAHVLLAASSALAAGHGRARDVLDDVLDVIDTHFWSEEEGASREDFDRHWRELDGYRGANANMHLTEAFLAAADVAGHPELAARAARIASLLVDERARANGWLIPEHYDSAWRADLGRNRDRPDDPFRPYGATIGHSLEWSRLLLGVRLATGSTDGWYLEAAEALWARAVDTGWDHDRGGFVYTVDWDGTPVADDHYWWPVAEGIAAASHLGRVTGAEVYETWYRRLWEYAASTLVDDRRGGWYPQFDADNRPAVHPWYGKPDLYHCLQATLLPLLPVAPSFAGAALRSRT